MTGIVGISSMSASGEETVQPTPQPATVSLEITGETTGQVVFTVPGVTKFSQVIVVDAPCNAVKFGPLLNSLGEEVGNKTLLTFSAKDANGSATTQLRGSGIGVQSPQNTSCGGPAGKIGPPGELLTVKLGTFLEENNVVGGHLLIGKTNRADNDLVIKYNNEAEGAPVGIDIVRNYKVDLADREFTSLTLRSTATQSSRGLSLDGLTFEVDGFEPVEVECGDELDPTNLGDGALGALFSLGVDDDGGCDDIIPVRLIITDEGVLLDKGDSEVANATLTIEWAPVDPTDPVRLSREVNFFPFSDDEKANRFVPLQWCLSSEEEDVEVDGEPVRTVFAEHPQFVGPDDHPFAGKEVPWCLIDNTEYLEGGKIRQVQVLHGKGDPSFR
jgi:hypothetical protein